MVSQKSGSSLKDFFETRGVVGSFQDDQIAAALEEYTTLRRAGHLPQREDFLARHGTIAVALAECLDGLELVENAASHFTLSRASEMPDSAVSPPGRVGEFRLVREIGHGGMGVVFEAEQLPLGRRVALKVLPAAASLDSRHRQRFQVEAQAAGLLHHEHIVPVFGAGFDSGVYYYVMQLIDGRPLTEVLRDLRAAPSPEVHDLPGIELPPPASPAVRNARRHSRSSHSSATGRRHCQAAAQWAVQAADALEHAHQIGVIHRDIKPSNLLIDRRDHLWVTDFGLARLPQDDNELTHTGDVVGTLRYMSPEQIRGERGKVDARTDIYALGVTLYELLTLSPAFDGRDRQELRAQILRDEPPPPRGLNPSISRDLETVVMKAMEKEPAARYGSARELAGDLRRFLADQPVRARRPTVLHRAVKWSHRHRRAVVTAACGLVLALMATVVVLWELKRRNDATIEAFRRMQFHERLALEYALGAIDEMTRSAMETRQKTPGALSDDEATRVLPYAIAFAEQVRKTHGKNESTREIVAKASRQSGRSRLMLGDSRGKEDYRRAIQFYEEMAARWPERIWLRTGLIETLREYATLLSRPADATEADGSTRRALEVADSLIGDPSAALPCFRKGLIAPFNGLARDLVSKGVPRPGDVAHAVRIARQAVDWDAEQSDSWRSLGLACYRAGDWPSAAESVKSAMDHDGGGNAADWFSMAAINHYLGKAPEARRWYDRALSGSKETKETHDSAKAELLRTRDEARRVLGLPASDTGTGG
jgi:serine/threonine protein kinase